MLQKSSQGCQEPISVMLLHSDETISLDRDAQGAKTLVATAKMHLQFVHPKSQPTTVQQSIWSPNGYAQELRVLKGSPFGV